jgi:hypothetical protein
MMKRVAFLLLFAAVLAVPPAAAQVQAPVPASFKSSKKAFGLSVLVPGLGHRYAQGGSWRGGATLFALIEGSLWFGLISAEWQRDHRVQSYTTLAAGQAGAQVAGKTRAFFLNLATYRSSDEYLEVQLRNRAWEEIDYAAERAYQWEWQTNEAFQRFRALREDAESLRRRRTFLVAALVGNRLLSGLTAIRVTNRANREAGLAFAFAPPPPGTDLPALQVQLRF